MAKLKYYHLWAEALDANGEKHYVTVVGKFEQNYVPKEVSQEVPVEVKPGSVVKGKLTFNKRTLHRVLTVGVSICHPLDEFDEEFGVEIAKARIERGEDAGSIETNSVTMLTEDLIMAELLGKLSYIAANINDYIA
jgi:hypothetical protein